MPNCQLNSVFSINVFNSIKSIEGTLLAHNLRGQILNISTLQHITSLTMSSLNQFLISNWPSIPLWLLFDTYAYYWKSRVVRNNRKLKVHLYYIYYSKLPVRLYSNRGTHSLTGACAQKCDITVQMVNFTPKHWLYHEQRIRLLRQITFTTSSPNQSIIL